MNPLATAPPKVRKAAYVVYAWLVVAVGATQVGFVAAQADQPDALLVTLAVLAYVGAVLGFTAAPNTPTD